MIYRVAISSTDRKVFNQHFGLTERFCVLKLPMTEICDRRIWPALLRFFHLFTFQIWPERSSVFMPIFKDYNLLTSWVQPFHIRSR